MDTRKLIGTLTTSASFVCDVARKVLDIRKLKANSKNDTAINEILFYGADNQDETRKTGLDNLLCIYYVILHANRSIDVCVPSLVSETIAKCLITVQHKNKVKIRIAIHSSDDFHNLQLFAQNGIEVKIISPAVRLEHEFILIDASENFNDAVAVLGSLDYDTVRVNCNRDATILTSENTVIRNLKREFDRVWNSVADITNGKNDKML